MARGKKVVVERMVEPIVERMVEPVVEVVVEPIVGEDPLAKPIVVLLLSRRHLLLEGGPGLCPSDAMQVVLGRL